jgi:hypothetical protein
MILTKKPKTYTEQLLLSIVVDYSWKEGYYSKHDTENDLLQRIQKAIHKDYPMSRFHVMSLNVSSKPSTRFNMKEK